MVPGHLLIRHGARALVIAVLGLAACTSGRPVGEPVSRPGGSAGSSSRSAATTAAVLDWPTYHGANDRAGAATGPSPQLPLRIRWRTPLDGAVYAQPIVARGRVLVATGNDTVYALDPATGAVRWRTRLGRPQPLDSLPCGNVDPLGITGTPAYDAATGQVFAVTETVGAFHALVALDASTGRVRWRRGLDVVPGRDRRAEQQRAAVLVTAGHVYVAFGGLFGDCGNYVGYVAAVAADGAGAVRRYVVPTARAGGIWAPPGPVVGPAGDLYVSVGNGAATGGGYDGSDSVIRLTTDLRRTGLFVPTTWAADNAGDLDLGSSSPVPVGARLVVAGKRGTVFLLRASLGGVGGELSSLAGCAAYGGGARRGSVVVLPCEDGVRSLEVSGDRLRWRWRLGGVAGSPIVVGDDVVTLDTAAGVLVDAALATGHVRARVRVADVTRFATPVPVGSLLLVGTTRGVVAVS